MSKRADLARWAQDVFSTASVRGIVRGRPSRAERALKEYAGTGISRQDRAGLARSLNADLRRHYRGEYVYKDAIANKILLGRYSLGAAMLSEFRIGSSIADSVLVNGAAVVYEIKTELDSSAKLEKQLADYYSVFDRVNVVVHESLVEKYEVLLEGSPCGIIAFTARSGLSVRKPPAQYSELLRTASMMRALRRHEYVGVLEAAGLSVPDVPPVQFFRECALLADAVDPHDYLRLMTPVLKQRTIRERELASRDEFRPFRYQILQLDPSRRQMETSLGWLRETVT